MGESYPIIPLHHPGMGQIWHYNSGPNYAPGYPTTIHRPEGQIRLTQMDGVPIPTTTTCSQGPVSTFASPPGWQAEELLAPGDLTKPLSALYGALLGTNSPKLEKLWESWHRDIPSLDREGWEDCLEYGPKLVISSKDKLMVKFLHGIYYTSQIHFRTETLHALDVKHM